MILKKHFNTYALFEYNQKTLCLAIRHDRSEALVIHLAFLQQKLLKRGKIPLVKVLMSKLIITLEKQKSANFKDIGTRNQKYKINQKFFFHFSTFHDPLIRDLHRVPETKKKPKRPDSNPKSGRVRV